jgi:hypothetical protein
VNVAVLDPLAIDKEVGLNVFVPVDVLLNVTFVVPTVVGFPY